MVIARMGRWHQAAAAMFQSYLMFFKPEGLLASGSWPGALEKDFGMFWAPRFCVEVPRSLIEYLFPWLLSLEQEVDDLGADAQPSHLAAPKVVAFAGSVLVQDALDLAPRFPDNLVHKHLLANDEFRAMLDKYQRKVAAGYYEQLRPRALRERLDEVCYLMYQICSGKLVQPAAVDRLNLERSRAYGGLSSSEEQQLHEQRLQRIENADDATLTAMMAAEPDLDADCIMRQPLGGHQLPAHAGSEQQRLPQPHPAAAPARHSHLSSGAALDGMHEQADMHTPTAPSRPAPSQPSQHAQSMQLAALDAFTPPDARILTRPFQAQMAPHMLEQRGGGAHFLRRPADSLAVPPAMPPAPTVLAPLPEHGSGHDDFYMHMYLTATQYLASRGLLGLAQQRAQALVTGSSQPAPAPATAAAAGGASAGTSRVPCKSSQLQAAAGIPFRPVPELRAMTLQEFWDLWDKGSRDQPALRALEEEHGNAWRRDEPGDKSKNNSKRWSDINNFVKAIHLRMLEEQVTTPSKVLRLMEQERLAQKVEFPTYVKKVVKANAKPRKRKVDAAQDAS